MGNFCCKDNSIKESEKNTVTLEKNGMTYYYSNQMEPKNNTVALVPEIKCFKAFTDSNTNETKNRSLNLFVKQHSYILHELLGEGGFGKIYKISKISTKESFALKYLSDEIEYNKVNIFMNEIGNLKLLKEKNCQKSLSIIESFFQQKNPEIFCFVMELFDMDLQNLLHYKKLFSAQQIIFILSEITDAITEIHKIKLSHNDIKPSNFILSIKKKEIKLCDFGVSKLHPSEELYTEDIESLMSIFQFFMIENESFIHEEYRSIMNNIVKSKEDLSAEFISKQLQSYVANFSGNSKNEMWRTISMIYEQKKI